MDLGWRPRYDFSYALDCLRAGQVPHSSLSRAVGIKGYHDRKFAKGSYPWRSMKVTWNRPCNRARRRKCFCAVLNECYTRTPGYSCFRMPTPENF